MNKATNFKWFTRWVLLSVVFDIGLLMIFGWTDFLATEWWKSLPMTLLVMPLWLGISWALRKSSVNS